MRLYKCEDESQIQFLKRKAYYARLIQPRLVYSKNTLASFLASADIQPISQQLLAEIKRFWISYLGNHVRLIDFRWYDVFNTIEENKDLVKYYMPDDFYYAFIDEYYSNPQHAFPCDDKNFYDLYFPEVKKPITLFRKVGQSYLTDTYESISLDEILNICRSHKRIIIKPSRFSYGGKGISFIENNLSDNEVKNIITSFNGPFICQEVIEQNAELNKLNDTSLNTIRIMSLVRNGEVQILSPVVRVGNRGSKVDNLTSGGMVCGINCDGTLKNRVLDKKLHKHEITPSGFRFPTIKIPNFEQCTNLVKKMALRFSGITKLMSWDFAIDKEGDPVLIEVNLSFSGVDVHQLVNGPIYGKHPEPIIEEVVNNSYTLRKLCRF